MTIFEDKLLTSTYMYCDEAGDYAVPNVLSPRDLVFRPDIVDINCTATNTAIFNTCENDILR